LYFKNKNDVYMIYFNNSVIEYDIFYNPRMK